MKILLVLDSKLTDSILMYDSVILFCIQNLPKSPKYRVSTIRFSKVLSLQNRAPKSVEIQMSKYDCVNEPKGHVTLHRMGPGYASV